MVRKLLVAGGVLVASAVLAASASATVSPGPPATFSAEATNLVFGNAFISCDSQLTGFIDTSGPAGAGGTAYVTGGVNSNCGFGRSMTGDYTEPWLVTMTPDAISSDVSYWTIEDVRWTWLIFGVVCRYHGTLSGTGSDADDTLTLNDASGLERVYGGGACPLDPVINAVYVFDQDIEVS